MQRNVVGRWLGIVLVVLTLLMSAPPTSAALSLEISLTTSPGEYLFEARGFRDNEDVATWLT